MTKLSVLASVFSTDPRIACEQSRRAGFAGILLDAFSAHLDVTALSQTGRRELRHLLVSSDQQLVGLRVDVGQKGFGLGADVDRLLSQFGKVMEVAKGLGAPLLCVEAGPLPEPARESKPKPRVTAEQAGLIIIPELKEASASKETEPARAGPVPAALSHVDDALAALGALADRIGVTLAFRSELSSFAAIERALLAANCPWFGVDLDPVAILSDEWSSDEVFSRLGSLIRHVRARDAVVGSDRRTRPAIIGQGSTDWRQFLQSLEAAGYANWLTIDSLELPDRAGGATFGASAIRRASS